VPYRTNYMGINMTSEGFRVNVDELEKLAVEYLPGIATALRAPTEAIATQEDMKGPGSFPQFEDMRGAYENLCEGISQRQMTGSWIIDETANALREIATLYRRVDGQY
jgi:hypothetical protein